MRISASLFAAVLAVSIPVLSDPAAETPWRAWRSTVNADHPLAGRIWAVRDQRFLAPAELAEAAAKADFVLVGEVHDNPDHHRLQAWIVTQMAAQGRRPAIVLEMIDAGQQAALDAHIQGKGQAEGLGAAIGWEKSGWPAWAEYQPIAEAALAARLPLKAGSPTREETRTVGKMGLSALAAERFEGLSLSDRFSDHLQQALLDELFASHCELMPESSLVPMSGVQRFRDAVMADRMMAAGEAGAILIAGNGHVRTDRGVPWYLARRAPGKSTVVIVLAETDAALQTPEGYAPRDPDGNPAADYVWFTPAAAREDPCEALRQHFKKQ
jgi:uncharacterized iron-regulated protein